MNKGYQNELVQVFLEAKKADEMLDLLKGLLTLKEIEELETRLQIVKMLKDGVSQREIADKLSVGIATVTRGSREIKMGRFKSV